MSTWHKEQDRRNAVGMGCCLAMSFVIVAVIAVVICSGTALLLRMSDK